MGRVIMILLANLEAPDPSPVCHDYDKDVIDSGESQPFS